MRVVCQRVARASVTVAGDTIAEIGRGLLLLVGVEAGDTPREVGAAVSKIGGLRVFADGEGRMNLSIEDVGGEVLVVSQFTLLADARKGRRPSYSRAAPPAEASALITLMVAGFRERGIPVSEGAFGALMDVALVNQGPVTLVLDFAGGRAL